MSQHTSQHVTGFDSGVAAHLVGALAGDQHEFSGLTEPYRRELHCTCILGSSDAEDRETLLCAAAVGYLKDEHHCAHGYTRLRRTRVMRWTNDRAALPAGQVRRLIHQPFARQSGTDLLEPILMI
jgi:hypothetical protein